MPGGWRQAARRQAAYLAEVLCKRTLRTGYLRPKVFMPHVEGYTPLEPHGYLTGDYPNGRVVTDDRACQPGLVAWLVRFSLVAYTARPREA